MKELKKQGVRWKIGCWRDKDGNIKDYTTYKELWHGHTSNGDTLEQIEPFIFEANIKSDSSSYAFRFQCKETGISFRVFDDGMCLFMKALQDGWITVENGAFNGIFKFVKKGTKWGIEPVSAGL